VRCGVLRGSSGGFYRAGGGRQGMAGVMAAMNSH
jgi:hypothetical protein